MEKVDLYIININEARKYYSKMYAQISEARKERADSYYHEDDKLRSVCAAFLVKKFVKCEELKYNEYGKPYAHNGKFFNISHSGNFVALAISDYEVGVDVEAIKKRDLSFLTNIFVEDDIKGASLEDTYLLWCNKESLAKCVGRGLRDIKEAPAKPLNGKKIYDNECFYSRSFIYCKYAYSVTIQGPVEFEVDKKIVKVEKYFKK